MSRALYDDLVNYEGNRLYDDVLRKNVADIKSCLSHCEILKSYDPNFTLHCQSLRESVSHQQHKHKHKHEYKHKFRKILGSIWRDLKNEHKNARELKSCQQLKKEYLIDCLQALFALSVCNDYLIILLNEDKLSIDEYSDFFNSIGMTVSYTNMRYYNPFYHEIYKVVEGGKVKDERIVIKRELYPMVMFGSLQFSRAGVNIFAHPSVDKHLAENSCLFFTNQRENRECLDLSHGWGHNSRWRTELIRNYDTDNYWRFNVDGEINLADKQAFENLMKEYDLASTLNIEQAKELLQNRHFIHPDSIALTQLSNDIFPYDWKMEVAK